MLNILLENGADFKLKNASEYSPLDVASSYTDKEILTYLFDKYSERRLFKVNRNFREVMSYFKTMKDFYVEVNWEIHIPVLSFLCPKDKIKVWKKGTQIRMDTTFVDFKKLSTIRANNSHYVTQRKDSDIVDIFRCDRDKKVLYNYYEPLDEEEKKVIVQEICDKKRVKGNFKILSCKLKESLSLFGNKIFEKVNGYNTQKFEVSLEVQMELHPNEILLYDKLTEENYMDKNKNIVRGKMKVKENKSKYIERAGEYDKDMKVKTSRKKLKAYAWAIANGPIKSADFLAMVDSIASMNDVTEKMREFFKQPQLQELINKNYFPVKIQIPYNIFVDFTVYFTGFKQFEPNESIFFNNVFEIFDTFRLASRKEEENLVKSDKKRGKYVNMR